MQKFIADTNIIIQKVRQSKIWDDVEKNYFSKGVNNYGFISYVTVGELFAFAYENRWGKNKMDKLRESLAQFQYIPIEVDKKIKKNYVQISAYSRNRHKSLRLPKKFPATDMGKNDLWIAATAAAGQMPLITTDKDFFHLAGNFIELIYIDQSKYFTPPPNV